MDSNRPLDLRVYLRVLWRRKSLWLLPPVVTLCAAAIGLNVVPQLYEARAKIYYEDRSTLPRGLQEIIGAGGGNYYRPEDLAAQRQMEILAKIRSRPFLERVVRTLRLEDDPFAKRDGIKVHEKHPELSVEEATMQLLVDGLRIRLSVDAIGSNVYTLVARDTYARNAQLLARWVTQLFVDNSVGTQMQGIRAAGNFSEEQLTIYKKKLQDAQDRLRAFQETMLGRQLASNPVGEKNRESARMLVRNAESEVSYLQDMVGRLPSSIREEMNRSFRTVTAGPGLRGATDELNRTETDLGVLLLDAKAPGDVSVPAQKDRVGGARQQVYDLLGTALTVHFPGRDDNSLRDLRDAYYSQIQMNSIRARREKLQGYIDAYERNYRQAPREQLELDRLRQDVESNKRLLDAFQSQSTSSRLSEAVESQNLGMRMEILEQPDRPLDPVSPDPPRVIGLALLLGPLLGFGVVFLAEYFDHSFRTVEEIEAELSLPVLGTMPRPEGGRSVHAPRRRWIPIAITAMLGLTAVFFALKFTVLPDLGRFSHQAVAQDPGASTPEKGTH